MPWSDGLREMDIHPLGPDRYMTRMVGPDGALEGIVEVHTNAHGDECVGAVPFNMLRKPNFMYTGEWPNISVTPSILCKRCMNHGYIRDGKWVPA